MDLYIDLCDYLNDKPDDFEFEFGFTDKRSIWSNKFTKKDFMESEINFLNNSNSNLKYKFYTERILNRSVYVIPRREINNYIGCYFVIENE